MMEMNIEKAEELLDILARSLEYMHDDTEVIVNWITYLELYLLANTVASN